MTQTRTRAEALVHEWKLRDNYETEEIDNIRLIQRITQALDAERQAALEEAAAVADDYHLRDPAQDGNGYWASQEIAQAIRQQAQASLDEDDAVS